MKGSYENLTRYEKNFSWKTRFGVIYRLYLRKLWVTLIKDKKTWIFNSLIILPIIAGPIVALFTDSLDPADYFALYSDIMFLGYIGLIIPLFTMYIASMLFNEEINDQTICYLTTRPIHRIELVLTKYLSFLTFVPLFTAASGLLFYLSFAIFGGFAYFDAALMFLLATVVSTAVYGAFFLFLGALFKNPLWFGLFFTLVWEFIFATFSGTLSKLTIAYYIKSLLVKGDPSPVIIKQNQAYEFNFFSSGGASLLNICFVLSLVVVVSLTLTWFKVQAYTFRSPFKTSKRLGGWKHYLKEIRSALIAFGIIVISIGLVFGPVNGTKKTYSQNYDAQINISRKYFYGNENFRPSIEDMGYGDYITYSLKKGDSLNVNFEPITHSSIQESYWGLLLTKNDFDNFFAQTQELWLDYYEQVFFNHESRDLYLSILLDNYFIVVNSLVDKAKAKVSISSSTIDPKIDYSATTSDSYCFAFILGWYDYTTELYFSNAFSMDLTRVISRTVWYALGWALFGVGVISSGFAIYSLVTYSSKGKTKRDEESQTLPDTVAEGNVESNKNE